MIHMLLAAALAAPPTLTIHTEDVTRFYEALEQAETLGTRRALRDHYLKPGTPGLAAFSRREFRLRSLASQVDASRAYYDHLQTQFADWPAIEPQVQDVWDRFVAHYPDARSSEVTIVVGRFTSGGFIADPGVLVGLELFGRTPDLDTSRWPQWLKDGMLPMSELEPLIVHELVHWQQVDVAPDGTARGFHGGQDRLAQVIREGAADFVAEMLCGRHTNPVQKAYGLEHEAALWAEFHPERHARGAGRWLYAKSPDPEVPKDLGYFIGYRIVQAYYAQAEDPQQALREILSFDDAEQLLIDSGYSPT
ncbi:MAG: hypothetical protein KC912_23750 [Proteobacteria bacterium]|nr:hypothetical protein [Pseudomonadota bacterium]